MAPAPARYDPRRSPALWLAGLAFALYLPLALSLVTLSADVTEYVDLARRLAAGQGYVLGIKAYHTGGTAVLHNGLDERAPLFPMLAAGLLKLGLGLPAVQALNALLAAGCVGLTASLGGALFGRAAGWLAGSLAAVSPVLWPNLVLPMSEAAAIFLTLLGTWLLVHRPGATPSRRWLAAGVVWGLAYLARPTALPMALLVAGALVLGRPGWPIRFGALLGPPRRLCPFLLGLALCVVPISLASWVSRGSLSYSGQAYHYAVFRSTDVLRDATLQPLPTPLQFVTANADYVAGAMAANVRAYAAMLFLDRRWLLPLILAWPVALFALVRRHYSRRAVVLLLLAAANFLVYALTWASSYQPRYMLLTLLLLLPFGVDGLRRLGLGRLGLPLRPKVTALHLVVLALVLFWGRFLLDDYRARFWTGPRPAGSRTLDGLTWTGPSEWVEDPDLPALLDWIRTETGSGDVLAYRDPWPLTFFSGRPSTLLPRRLDSAALRRFLIDYRVAYVLQRRTARSGSYEDDLESLVAAGSRPVTLGAYRVFDTRGLWR